MSPIWLGSTHLSCDAPVPLCPSDIRVWTASCHHPRVVPLDGISSAEGNHACCQGHSPDSHEIEVCARSGRTAARRSSHPRAVVLPSSIIRGHGMPQSHRREVTLLGARVGGLVRTRRIDVTPGDRRGHVAPLSSRGPTMCRARSGDSPNSVRLSEGPSCRSGGRLKDEVGPSWPCTLLEAIRWNSSTK